MINTGPVTSHTVLLNLFPATQKHESSEVKNKNFTFNLEDMKRIKKVYGSTVVPSKQLSYSVSKESSKVKIGSTLVTSGDKHRHIKYPVQTRESKKQYSSMTFPLSNRRLEAVKPLKTQGSVEADSPRATTKQSIHGGTLEQKSGLKVPQPNMPKRTFFKTNGSKDSSKQSVKE